MAKGRKTMDVQAIKEEANRLLAVPDNQFCNADFRRGVSTMIEHVLMRTNNYHGFGYIEWRDGGCAQWEADGKPEDNTKYLGDQTRKFYY